jgi:hypothetical protein
LREQFLEVHDTSTYPAQERNPKGEVHDDVGYIGFDRARNAFVFRQFHAEGFVNTYVGGPEGSARIVMTSETIENIPPGWRARETYVVAGPDEFEEMFELAGPGKDFELYTRTRLKRVK